MTDMYQTLMEEIQSLEKLLDDAQAASYAKGFKAAVAEMHKRFVGALAKEVQDSSAQVLAMERKITAQKPSNESPKKRVVARYTPEEERLIRNAKPGGLKALAKKMPGRTYSGISKKYEAMMAANRSRQDTETTSPDYGTHPEASVSAEPSYGPQQRPGIRDVTGRLLDNGPLDRREYDPNAGSRSSLTP